MAESQDNDHRPDVETQKTELGALMGTSLEPGAQWYLVDSRWFKQWKKYVGFDSWDMYNMGKHSLFPGPIDNSGLFSDPESQTLKEHLVDELDYVLVPAEAWNKLLNWYGCVEGQQPIVRKVVEHGLHVKHCKVEVYLLELKLCENSDPTDVRICHFSRADTIATIEKEMRKLFNIPAERETRLWNKYMRNTYEHLSKLDNTIQDAGLYHGQVLVIEPQNEDGTWPKQILQSNGSGFSISYKYQEHPLPHLPHTEPGLCEPGNLGNTCVMNSALQCLNNSAPLTENSLKDECEAPLTENSLKDECEAEINRDNPLGVEGEIAEAYAEFIREMCSGQDTHVTPQMFKGLLETWTG